MFSKVLELKDKMHLKRLRANLIILEERIADLSEKFCMDESEKKILHRDLEKLYSEYTAVARKFLQETMKHERNNIYKEKQLAYFGWKHIVMMNDKLYLQEVKKNG